jgi:hypothetical protein
MGRADGYVLERRIVSRLVDARGRHERCELTRVGGDTLGDGGHSRIVCGTLSGPRVRAGACYRGSRLAGARRRGRRERRHQLADLAERVPPESRRGVAGGRRPDARHHGLRATDGAELPINR